jgi:RNA polymerase sigma-70 factor (ECF subfamily)
MEGVQLCRSRDEKDQFQRLMEEHQPRLLKSMGICTGDPEFAADVCQEAWCQAWRNLGKFKGKSAFYTWIYRIACNIAASHKRKKNSGRTQSLDEIREVSGDEPVHRIWDMDGAGPSPDARLIFLNTKDIVHRMMRWLPPMHRDVIRLRDMQGEPYQRIADALGLPVGTVRSRLHRGREQLRKLLSTQMQNL